MRIVINIPDWQYKSICKGIEASKKCGVVGPDPVIHEAIYNGTPLPKGHGRLIDADELKKNNEEYIIQHPTDREEDMQNKMVEWINEDITDAPTIVEADTTRDCKTCGHSNGGKCAYTEECHECMFENKYIEADKDGKQEYENGCGIYVIL